MITETTIEKRNANSIEDMQYIARNQIKFRIYDLEDRIEALKKLYSNIEVITNHDDLDGLLSQDTNLDEVDVQACDAINELAEYYETMKKGYYF